ncbi:MAG TPA: CinA family protein, partial [Myxococcus sp.]|nr:CinA family protein [Myxococcus sp.]
TPQKPVGLAYVAVLRRGGQATVERHVFPGDRSAVRRAVAERALTLLLEKLEAGS